MNDTSKSIWIYSLLIITMGLVALYSASFNNVRVSQQVFFDQLYCALLAVVIMYALSRVDIRRFYDFSYILYGISLFMLLVVLLGGRHALGARRWMEIGGFSFQPSEVTKLALIFLLGRYLSQRRAKLTFNLYSSMETLWHDFLFPLMLTLIPVALIFKQPDLGTSILLLGIFLIMAFAADIDFLYILGFIGFCIVMVPFGWHFLHDYQKDRLLVFLNPNIDPLGAGYTIIQSKIAVGSGQMFGKGWLSGTQNQLNFLPERHTDFIFSVVGEEWGLLGAGLMLLFFFLLIQACLDKVMHMKDRFCLLVGVGIVGILSLQVIINVGMVIGLFPIVGITLPFVSYGRTSFLVFAILMGFMLSLSRKRTVF